jgi:hypothetical protein
MLSGTSLLRIGLLCQNLRTKKNMNRLTIPSKYRFEHEKALECRDWIASKIGELRSQGLTADEEIEDNFSPRLYIYERILPFAWEYFPDYTVPWHLLMLENCRWEHVYSVITIIECLKQPTGSRAGQPINLDPFQDQKILMVSD